MTHSSSQRGSAFFIILIAIAMFAALSYAVFKGGSGGTAALTKDQARLAAQEMIAYANTIQKTVQTMKLRGVREHEFDFSNTVFIRLNNTNIVTANSTCTSDYCKVFNANGGKLTAKLAPVQAQIDQTGWVASNWKSGSGGFRVLQIDGVGTSSPDLTFLYAFIRKDVCIAINDILGIDNPSGTPPYDSEGTMAAYTGNLAAFPNPAGYGLGDEATALSGKTQFCTKNDGGESYYFWTVLLAR